MVKNKTKPSKKIAILEAAINLIADNGFHASPIAMIAQEAGVAVGTLYTYFKSKDQLINEAWHFIEKKLIEVVIKDQTNGSVANQFKKYCRKYIIFSLDNPQKYKFVNQYIDSPYGLKVRRVNNAKDDYQVGKQTLLYPYYILMNRGKKQGLIKDLPNALLFTIVYGAMSNFIRDVMIGIIDYDAEVRERIVDICWNIVNRQGKSDTLKTQSNGHSGLAPAPAKKLSND